MARENECTCVGGCNMNSLGYHPEGKLCMVYIKPGPPAQTVENPGSDAIGRLARAKNSHPPKNDLGEKQYLMASRIVNELR